MKGLKYAAALGLLALVVLKPVRADIFQASGTFSDGSSLTGTVTIDTTTGTVTAENLMVGLSLGPFSINIQQSVEQSLYVEIQSTPVQSAYDFAMFLPTSTLVGYSGGSICSFNEGCVYYVDSQPYVDDSDLISLNGENILRAGTLTSVTTPEPSSLFLLGTFLLGLAPMTRPSRK
jgi:hypothetical protein